MIMEVLAWLAAFLVFTSFFMKTIVPLRTFAIASNVAFVGYAIVGIDQGLSAKVLPILVLHVALLPLNIIRLREVMDTIKLIRHIEQQNVPYEFLIPFMKSITHQSGDVLFHKGEQATTVYILKSGSIALVEPGKTLGPGALFGEVSIFSEDSKRTATARCETNCELFVISGEKVLELFYQDRKFSFKIARLLAGYA